MALHFNSDSGTDDYLNKSVSIFSGKTYPLAFTAWVRPDDRGAQHAVVSDSGSGSSKQVRLGCTSNGKFQVGMKGANANSPSAHYDNGNTTWFHLTALFIASNNYKLYVNGTLDATQTTNSNISDFADSNQFYIGTGVSSGTNIAAKTWEGGLAEVAAYAAELTAGEISALAAGYSPLLVRPDALVGYWPLGGPLASSASNNDFVGGNHLTTNGGVSEENHPPMIYPSDPILARKPLSVVTVTADGSVSEYARTPDTSGTFTKPYDTSSTYSRDAKTTGTFTRPSE